MITINSFGTELTKEDRSRLFPKCGKLYPDGLIALSRAEDFDQVRVVAENYGVSIIQNRTKLNRVMCVGIIIGPPRNSFQDNRVF